MRCIVCYVVMNEREKEGKKGKGCRIVGDRFQFKRVAREGSVIEVTFEDPRR